MVNASLTHFNERFCAQIFANRHPPLWLTGGHTQNRKVASRATSLNFTLSSQSRSV